MFSDSLKFLITAVQNLTRKKLLFLLSRIKKTTLPISRFEKNTLKELMSPDHPPNHLTQNRIPIETQWKTAAEDINSNFI